MNPKRIIASIGVLTAQQKSPPQIGNPPPVLTFFNPAIPLPTPSPPATPPSPPTFYSSLRLETKNMKM